MANFIARSLFFLFSLCFFTKSVFADSDVNAVQNKYNVAIEADDVVSRVLFNAASTKFEFVVEYKNYNSFDEILNAVESGEVDFAANVTYTAEREKRFDFSRPTNIEYTYLYSKEGVDFDQLKRVAVPVGTIYSELIQTHYPNLNQVTYEGGNQAIEWLEEGKVDGVIDAINQLKPMLSSGFYATLLNDYLPIQPVAIIATKGQHLEVLNQLESFTHSSTIQRLLSRSVQNYQLEIREQTLRAAALASGINDRLDTYKVKLENGGQYVQYHKDGSVDGISADIVLRSCEILSIHCEVTSDADEPWASMYGDLLDYKIDILAPVIKSKSREKLMHFSDAYYNPVAVIIKRKGYKDDVYHNVSELLVERIGVVRDDFFQSLLNKMLPNVELYMFDTQQDLFDGLLNGKVDYIASSKEFFEKLLSESEELIYIEEDKQIGTFYTSEVAIAFPNTENGEVLAQLFSQAMKLIDIQSIVAHYNIQPDWRERLLLEQKVTRQEMLLLICVLVLLIGLATYFHIQSNTDGLTKLRNRRSLYRRYSRGVSPRTAFVYLDVNNFKQINDTYGHETGDKVLKQLTERINTLWAGGRYRIGGDEFILTGDISLEKLNKILVKFEHFTYIDLHNSNRFDVSISVGASVGRGSHASLEDVLHLADVEMYRAKYRRRATDNPGQVFRQSAEVSNMLSNTDG